MNRSSIDLYINRHITTVQSLVPLIEKSKIGQT